MQEKIRQFLNPQRLEYMAVGLVMTAANLTIMILLVEVLGFNVLIVNLCRLTAVTPIRFFVYRCIVWTDNTPLLPQFGRYLVHKSGGIVVKQLAYATLVAFGTAYWVAYLVCTLAKGTANYKVLSGFVFRQHP